jgi:opacity protein-like surface antigen
MKVNIIATICVFLLISSLAHGQTHKGDCEISLSGYLGSMKQSYKYTSTYGNYEDEGEAESYVVLSLRSGYYFTDMIEFEPEIFWTAQENLPPAFALNANMAFNFNLPNSKYTPFLLIGYGYANGIPITQRLMGRMSDKLDISCLNLGAGLKVFLAEPLALRLEYRYQSYNYETSESYFSGEITYTFHTILVGFSFML